jgi:hypothetical protein
MPRISRRNILKTVVTFAGVAFQTHAQSPTGRRFRTFVRIGTGTQVLTSKSEWGATNHPIAVLAGYAAKR